MKPPAVPITDDHIHIDPVNGRGIEAAKDFRRAGGTHLFLVSKPSSSFGISPRSGPDYAPVFEETLRVAQIVREAGIGVFPVLGVHPAEISVLAAEMPLRDAMAVMMAGLDLAAGYVEEGRAVALKSGRPHYAVTPEVMEASCTILSHAFRLAASLGCAVQVHAESGSCADLVPLARREGLASERVVKHYAEPETPLHPSLLATHPAVPGLVQAGRPFTLESDYMDENSRPGAVIGPKSVPRVTRKLLEAGTISVEDAWRIHAEIPSRVYGVTIAL